MHIRIKGQWRAHSVRAAFLVIWSSNGSGRTRGRDPPRPYRPHPAIIRVSRYRSPRAVAQYPPIPSRGPPPHSLTGWLVLHYPRAIPALSWGKMSWWSSVILLVCACFWRQHINLHHTLLPGPWERWLRISTALPESVQPQRSWDEHMVGEVESV